MDSPNINPHHLASFIEVFRLCQATRLEKIIVLSETQSRTDNLLIATAALDELGLDAQQVQLETPRSQSGPIIRSTGATTILDNQAEVVDSLCEADFIVDLSVEGLMHASATKTLLASGARIMNVSNEHPETLSRLVPIENDKLSVKAAVQRCRSAGRMSVVSDAGTALQVDMTGAATVGVWGWTDRPGTLAHWPGGLVVSFPAAKSVNGRLVMAPGDINLTFKRYLESEVVLTIEDDYVVAVDGSGADARLMRHYLQAFDERDAYATSHVGWGINTRARYEALTMLDKVDTNGTELRALAGNFLYSTGANEFAGRFTRGHFDLPVMDCTISLDDEPVVVKGALIT